MANLGYIQVARRCNQKCLFCSNPDNGRILSLKQAEYYVDDFVARDYAGIILTGGEPTLLAELDDLIRYANENGMPSRLITNGQKTANYNYLKTLSEAGLTHLHLSVHSHREEVHDHLTQTPGSLRKQIKSLENAEKIGVRTDINTVINRRNADHLHEIVRWLVETFPFLQHFVWNNIDPSMNKDMDHAALVPELKEFEVSLYKAMRFLDMNGRTFRVEKVPLCYMAEYAHVSTETRKIVKHEERLIHFLDQKESFCEVKFEHGKTEVCGICRFNPICAGLFKADEYISSKALSPVFLDPEDVRKSILDSREYNPDTREGLSLLNKTHESG